jgi:hypothetical protein
MAIDPDFACMAGVMTGQIASASAVLFSWGGSIISPTLALIGVLFISATLGAVCLGHIARKGAQMLSR